MSNGYPISVGQATHSLADTSARHTIVGRLCTSMYQSLVEPTLVISNKEDYKAVREEVALGVGCAYNDEIGISPGVAGKGPVNVITNVAPFRSGGDNDLMAWYIRLYDCRTLREMRAHVSTPCIVKNQTYYPPELYFAGFVMSHNSQAHPANGDTAVTLFMGGIITVKNGRYPVRGGDKIQWYFEEEADNDMFEINTDGLRTPRETMGNNMLTAAENNSSNKDGVRQPLSRYNLKVRNRQYGERALTKRPVYVKSCRPGMNGRGSTVMDKRRVFGKATGDAGPFEYVDIKICRQSL